MGKLGIVAALPGEARCLYPGQLQAGTPQEIQNDIHLCLSGMGRDGAAAAVGALLAREVDALISWGVAGALGPGLGPGDLLLARTVIASGETFSTSPAWLGSVNRHCQTASLSPFIANLVSNDDKVCTTRADKQALFETTGARAVDTESGVIAETAARHGLDFMVIRAIADDTDTGIPDVVVHHTDSLGRLVIGPAVMSCLASPKQIKTLWQLARAYKKALKTLKQCAGNLKKSHFLYKM